MTPYDLTELERQRASYAADDVRSESKAHPSMHDTIPAQGVMVPTPELRAVASAWIKVEVQKADGLTDDAKRLLDQLADGLRGEKAELPAFNFLVSAMRSGWNAALQTIAAPLEDLVKRAAAERKPDGVYAGQLLGHIRQLLQDGPEIETVPMRPGETPEAAIDRLAHDRPAAEDPAT